MPSAEVTLGNRLGLHARAAAKLVKLAERFECRIELVDSLKGNRVSAKSILEILTLSASKDAELIVETEGVGDERALREVVALFRTGFGETDSELFEVGMNFESMCFPGKDKRIGILGVPLGYAAATEGSQLGTTAMRLADFRGDKLLGHIKTLGYDVTEHGDLDAPRPKNEPQPGDKARYLDDVFEVSERMAVAVKKILGNGQMPVILGGDHSIAAGTFSGVSSYFRDQGEEIGMIWFDAHADMNTPETSPSGNLHGMPLATILGRGNPKMVELEGFSPKIKPELCAHIGARDLDLSEKELIYELGMRDNFFTMSDIDRLGMENCVEKSIEIASQAEAGFAVTFDVDIIDPRFAPGSGTLVRGGVTYREAHLALEMIAAHGGMRSFEIVEVNPVLDQSNITAKIAGELILSALGNTIL